MVGLQFLSTFNFRHRERKLKGRIEGAKGAKIKGGELMVLRGARIRGANIKGDEN